jgi:WhiB family redox-sensing transcriptional regulator
VVESCGAVVRVWLGGDRSLERLDWRAFALCADKDPELFFPQDVQTARAAVTICGQCPVRVECGRYAAGLPEVFGVWGGRWFGAGS